MALHPAFQKPIAHRGLHDRDNGIIENSFSAFDAAISGNFAIECDLQLTADDKAIVFHDSDLQRLTGQQGLVRDISASEMQRIPLLFSTSGDHPQLFEELLAQVAGRTLLVIELKEQKTEKASKALAHAFVKALGGYKGPLVIESFDPRALVLVRQAGYRGHVGIIIAEGYTGAQNGWQRFIRSTLLHWPLTRFSFISCNWQDLSIPMVRFSRAMGLPVTAWATRSKEENRIALKQADQVVFEGYDPRLV